MNEKRFVPSKYAGHTHDVKTDKHYYVTDEYVGCRELFDEIENLEKENEQLKMEKYELIKRVTNGIRISYTGYIQLEKENEQLRQENEKIIENKCTDCELVSLQTRKIDTLTNENEQLRQKIGICKDFLQQITLSDDVDGLNVTLWDILMENDDEEFGEYLKRKAILNEDFE